MKKYVLALTVFVITNICFAQDLIVKNDGNIIQAKVEKIGLNEIEYKDWTNLAGPTYVVTKSDIFAINYQNGKKELFTDTNKLNSVNSSSATLTHQKNNTDTRNRDLINLYSREYEPTSKVDKKKSKANCYFLIYGVNSNSIISNEAIEIKFIKHLGENPNIDGKYVYYGINVSNKTDKNVYIDKGNCFRILNDGKSICYYDNTEQITENYGGSSGGSIGLGAIGDVLGVGGVAGQIMGGISVGGGSSQSVSKTYSQQRILTIPPHSNRDITDEKWVLSKKSLLNKEYKRFEKIECFDFEYEYFNNEAGKSDFGINKGEIITFNENNSPHRRKYFITYSFDCNFLNPSSLTMELFLHQLIGTQRVLFIGDKHTKYINGLDEYSIVGYLGY